MTDDAQQGEKTATQVAAEERAAGKAFIRQHFGVQSAGEQDTNDENTGGNEE